MTITWYGHSCFKIANQGGRLIIITDPFNKNIGLNPPRGSADIVTVSHEHSDHNNAKTISGKPFIINSPGEYEVKGVGIIGCSSFHDLEQGKERGLNTIYLMKVDRIRLCHLGDLGQEQLTDEQLEAIGHVDILMVPVGGVATIGARKAVKTIKQLEPYVVIPMHYKVPGLKLDLKNLEEFLKEMGLDKQKPVDKLTFKKKDLINKTMEVVVMKL